MAAAGGGACPLDPFVIVPDMCEYVDHQILKLQVRAAAARIRRGDVAT